MNLPSAIFFCHLIYNTNLINRQLGTKWNKCVFWPHNHIWVVNLILNPKYAWAVNHIVWLALIKEQTSLPQHPHVSCIYSSNITCVLHVFTNSAVINNALPLLISWCEQKKRLNSLKQWAVETLIDIEALGHSYSPSCSLMTQSTCTWWSQRWRISAPEGVNKVQAAPVSLITQTHTHILGACRMPQLRWL